jgi:hypothetical protein
MQAQRLIPRREQNAASVETIRDAVAFGNVAGLDDSSPSFCIRPRPQEVSEEEQLTFDQNIMLGNANLRIFKGTRRSRLLVAFDGEVETMRSTAGPGRGRCASSLRLVREFWLHSDQGCDRIDALLS